MASLGVKSALMLAFLAALFAAAAWQQAAPRAVTTNGFQKGAEGTGLDAGGGHVAAPKLLELPTAAEFTFEGPAGTKTQEHLKQQQQQRQLGVAAPAGVTPGMENTIGAVAASGAFGALTALTNSTTNATNATAPARRTCVDTDDVYVNSWGYSCKDLYANPGWCNGYDTPRFQSAVMCCACGGGVHREHVPGATDAGGDGCSWYGPRRHLCGCCDDEDFLATNCDECGGAAPAGGAQPLSLDVELSKFPNKTTAIMRANFNLRGSIPGDLPARLPNLTSLDLSGNQLQGSIPDSLWQLPLLRKLRLRKNQLSGPLTAGVAAATRLELIDLSENQLSGSIPEGVAGWSSIKYVHLGSNDLSGALPDGVGRWTSILHVYLDVNKLTSLTDAVGNWTNLIHISINRNTLTGRIPSTVFNWAQVQYVYLQHNKLSGPIPEEVGAWSRAQRISLLDNQFSGPLPRAVANWTQVQNLYLHKNKLSGPIPEEVGAWGRAQHISLYDNQFSGPLPRAVANWTQVQNLYLHKNRLSGPIPEEVGAWGRAQHISLYDNQLSGPLPRAVANWTQVQYLYLHRNKLSGPIPEEVGAWSRASFIHLSVNELSGALPRAVADWTQVQGVYLGHNKLSGQIPEEVGAWSRAQSIYLSYNQFSGPIPRAVASWTQVRDVSLFTNKLSGPIPEEVGAWSHLQHIDLHENQFSGPIPRAVANWTHAQYVALRNNKLSGPIPEEVSAWSRARQINLYDNRLSGPIPRSVASWTHAQTVNLGRNKLSGPIPEEVGAWHRVQSITLEENRLSGSLPRAVASWTQAHWISLSQNKLSGPIPEEVGAWSHARVIQLHRNRLSDSLPRAIANWSSAEVVQLGSNRLSGVVPEALFQDSPQLTSLDLAENHLTGDFPSTQLPKLTKLWLNRNFFNGMGSLDSPALEELNISSNNLMELPETLYALSELKRLDLAGNRIARWPPRGVLHPRVADGTYVECGNSPREERFGWTHLQSLDVSGNPLGGAGGNPSAPNDLGDPIRVFVHSLAYLRELSELRCRGCELWGVLPRTESLTIAFDMAHTGSFNCTGLPLVRGGLVGLRVLDLAQNRISDIDGLPPPALLHVDLSDNNLQHLHRSWYNEGAWCNIAQLRLVGNPHLRALFVTPPSSYCPSAGVGILVADPTAYKTAAHGGFECTSLCAGTMTRYAVDGELNSNALCRCLPGHGGQGTNCWGCPLDTYSAALDELALVRECQPCPAFAQTVGANTSSSSQCLCPRGRYLSSGRQSHSPDVAANAPGNGTARNGTQAPLVCARCAQHPFQTTEGEGALSTKLCQCNGEYGGLKSIFGTCGCEDDHYMDRVAKQCTRCSQAELCSWGADVQHSLAPPALKPGFWAEPPPSDLAGFAGNRIWRCHSERSCLEGGCAEGRGGRACSLCVPGWFGGPDGPCEACPGSPEEQRWVMALGVLAVVPFPILLHCLLVVKAEDRGLVLALRAFRVSLKQMVKQVQTITVISGFSVDWPPVAKAAFDALRSLTVNLPSLAGAGCLRGQTSASLEMGFKWSLPLAFAVAVMLAVPLSWAAAQLARRCAGTRVGRLLPENPANIAMGRWDVARVMVFTCILFQATLVSDALEMLTCSPSPHGGLTVVSYPHIECSSADPEFLALALIATGMSIFFIGGLTTLMHAATRRTVRTMAATSRQERGWFAFIFEDFRDGYVGWALTLMAKDVVLVLIPVALPGQGAAQLLITAAFLVALIALLLRDEPFQDLSNTVLEAWNGALAASICLYGAGMGFDSSPSAEDITSLFDDGADDPAYRARAIGMVVVQALTMMVPFAIMTVQLLSSSQHFVWLVRRQWRPPTDEQVEKWTANFEDMMRREDLMETIRNFDSVDFNRFRTLFEQSAATMGHSTAGLSESELVKLSMQDLEAGAEEVRAEEVSSTAMKVGAEEDARTRKGDQASEKGEEIKQEGHQEDLASI